MSKTRLEWKVGLFVLIGLVLLGLLLLQFSKGLTFFRPTYILYLQAQDVGGVVPNSGVLMAGVRIGNVEEIRLAADGKSVTVTLKIFSRFTIHKDAIFSVEQSGFLGDQYIAVRPTKNEAPVFTHGETATAQKPFNLQEFIGSSGALIERVESALRSMEQAISNVNVYVLSPETLTNLSLTAGNLRQVTARAVTTLDHVNALLETNSPALTAAVSNLNTFSGQIQTVAGELDTLLATNSPAIGRAVKNVESSTEILKTLMEDVQAGEGFAGTVLKNEKLANDVAHMANNLSITSSNLNRLGLWGILWKKKEPKNQSPNQSPDDTRSVPLHSPKAPR